MHGIITAGVLGLLLYPLSMALIVMMSAAAYRGTLTLDAWTLPLLVANCGNLAAILVAAAISATRGLRATRALRLVPLIPLLPVYWTLMAVAAWQALAQFVKDPSGWEKTAHGVARERRTPFQCRTAAE